MRLAYKTNLLGIATLYFTNKLCHKHQTLRIVNLWGGEPNAL